MFEKRPKYVSNIFSTVKILFGRQRISYIRLMWTSKVGAAFKLCLTYVSSVAIGDARGFLWKRALRLVANLKGPTLLTLR